MFSVRTCRFVLLVVLCSGPASAQTQFADLRSQPFAGESFAVVLADVDGDGDLDVIIANGCGVPSQLHLNDGRGVFTNVTKSHMPGDTTCTYCVAVGDIDRDGIPNCIDNCPQDPECQ